MSAIVLKVRTSLPPRQQQIRPMQLSLRLQEEDWTPGLEKEGEAVVTSAGVNEEEGKEEGSEEEGKGEEGKGEEGRGEEASEEEGSGEKGTEEEASEEEEGTAPEEGDPDEQGLVGASGMGEVVTVKVLLHKQLQFTI